MEQNAKWELYKIDTTQITDEERRKFHVETLEEQHIKERKMNLRTLGDFYTRSGSVTKVIELIREEQRKKWADYDIGESGINSFGYQLMAQGKTEEALQIFKLNTQLYPQGYNTFDSYGECLLKVGRKEEALKAYRKSLELNPQNMNAQKALGAAR